MKFFRHLLPIVLTATLFSCAEDSQIEPSLPPPQHLVPSITKFVFEQDKNPQLPFDVALTINGKELRGELPVRTDLRSLVPTISHTGDSIWADFSDITPDISLNAQPLDFSQERAFTVRGEEGEETFSVLLFPYTGLPHVEVKTADNAPIDSRTEWKNAQVRISEAFSASAKDAATWQECSLKGHGNSTFAFSPKKPYAIKFAKKTQVLSMPRAKRWLLLAEYFDKSKLRNLLTFRMGHDSQLAYTPTCIPAMVYLNGKSQGFYNLSEQVRVAENRVEIPDGWHLIEVDWRADSIADDDIYFRSDVTEKLYNIKEPEEPYLTEGYNNIRRQIEEAERTLLATPEGGGDRSYRRFYDIQTYAEWYVISEITKNTDSQYATSCYFTLSPEGKAFMGPLWDYDLAYGNQDYPATRQPEGFFIREGFPFKQLFRDPEFAALVRRRFDFFYANRDTYAEFIRTTSRLLAPVAVEDNDVWKTLSKQLDDAEARAAHQAQAETLETWFLKRMEWLNNALER